MNGCQYFLPSFTLPANTASERNYDLAFLTKAEFCKKYKVSAKEYEAIISGTYY
jgi:hypothetical protein